MGASSSSFTLFPECPSPPPCSHSALRHVPSVPFAYPKVAGRVNNGGDQSYQFEPDCASTKKRKTKKRKTKTRKTSPVPPDMPEDPWDPLTDDLAWCICQQCPATKEIVERVCCAQLNTVHNIFADHLCVTENEAFSGVCLYEPVLRFNFFMQRYNECARIYRLGDPISNKSFRYCAYRAFTFWSQGRLGRFNRRVIPACVIHKIRLRYPELNGVYIGYREAHEVDEIDDFF